MKVLFVEDEKLLAEALKHLFESNDISADVAFEGIKGQEMALKGNYDLIVLDVMLPGRSGLEILKNIREAGHTEPVLMLTAKDSLEDKVLGLNLGADDYLVKPFEVDELLARVNALSRRARSLGGMNSPGHTVGDVTLHKETSEIVVGDEHISLTKREFDLLGLLVSKFGSTVSKKEILETVWEDSQGTSENSVELYIHYLRKKLKNSTLSIKTIRSQGYRLIENS